MNTNDSGRNQMSEAKISPLREQNNFNLQTTDPLHKHLYTLHKMKKHLSPAILPVSPGDNTTTPPFLPPFTATPNKGYNEGIYRDESAIKQENTGNTPDIHQE